MDFLSTLLFLLDLVALWVIFKKMGHEGWEGIVPFYNLYILFEEFYGNGWKVLLLLIPIYNIYLIISLFIKMAHAFGQSSGFGVGLALLSPIFMPVLAFGDYVYKDGTKANTSDDFISRSINNAGETIKDAATKMGKDPDAINKLKELEQLRQDGVITEEEFLKKKEELLKRI